MCVWVYVCVGVCVCVRVCGCKSRSGGVVCPGCLDNPEQSAQHSRSKWSLLSLPLGGACHNSDCLSLCFPVPLSPSLSLSLLCTHTETQPVFQRVQSKSDQRLDPKINLYSVYLMQWDLHSVSFSFSPSWLSHLSLNPLGHQWQMMKLCMMTITAPLCVLTLVFFMHWSGSSLRKTAQMLWLLWLNIHCP